jgi:hypothetical protein
MRVAHLVQLPFVQFRWAVAGFIVSPGESTMCKRALLGTLLVLVTSATASHAADQFTAKLTAFNPTTGLMVLNDRTTIGVDKKIVEGTMEIGAKVTVYFDGTENGYEQIYKVKIDPPGSPPPK